MHVLHLLDPATCGDEGILCCAAARSIRRAEGAPIRHSVWLIGDSRAEHRAWDLGIPVTDRITPRRWSPILGLAASPTRRALGRLRAARFRTPRPPDMPDIIQCWSFETAAFARQVFAALPVSPARVVLIPRTPACPPHTPRAPDSDLATGREIFIALDPTTQAAIAPFISRAGEAEAPRWLPTIRLAEPPIPSLLTPHSPTISRFEVRATLALDPTETTIGLLTDPPSAASAQRAMFAAGVLLAAGHRSTWLIPRGAIEDRRAATYQRAQSRRWGMVITDLSLTQLIAASDICIADARPVHAGSADFIPSCGPTAIALALAAGVPVVVHPKALPTNLAGHPWPVLPAPSLAPGRIAVGAARILESAPLRSSLAAAARTWGAQARARDDFRTTLAAIWLETANFPSSEPALPALT